MNRDVLTLGVGAMLEMVGLHVTYQSTDTLREGRVRRLTIDGTGVNAVIDGCRVPVGNIVGIKARATCTEAQ